MRLTAIAAFSTSVLLLAACGTTGDSQAPAPVDTPGGKPPGSVQTQPVKPVDVTGKPGATATSALKDPNNILSKRSIYYDLDKFDVKNEYRALVEAHAKYLRENPNARMLIQGNTDERGSREYNVGLGQRRSDGVKRMLTLLGARESQVESVSLGEEKPQDAGHSESAWSKNRRSDILYSGEY
ncbi:MAG TPA: peptidoglycan-associated lipoprotein Pal [Burkholderiales bacterium]